MRIQPNLILFLAVLGLAGTGWAYDTTTGVMPAADSLAARSDLVVEVTGVRNGSGAVLVSLFAAASGYPNDPAQAKALASAEIVSGTARAVFPALPAGTYALSIFHDENADGRLDTNWLGIPAEGVGSSNDAKGRFGPPSFEAAKFRHTPPAPTRQRVSLQYL